MVRKRPRPSLRRLAFLACLCIALVLIVPFTVRGFAQVCRQPLSVQPHLLALQQQLAAAPPGRSAAPWGFSRLLSSGRTWLARGTGDLVRLKQQDVIAYPAHVALAEALAGMHCSPYAIAVQWLKAGAHANMSGQESEVQAGLLRQAARVGGAVALATYLTQFLDPSYDPRGRRTIERLVGASTPGTAGKWALLHPEGQADIAMFASARRLCATLSGRY